jgi:hypothetical protein
MRSVTRNASWRVIAGTALWSAGMAHLLARLG